MQTDIIYCIITHQAGETFTRDSPMTSRLLTGVKVPFYIRINLSKQARLSEFFQNIRLHWFEEDVALEI